MTARTATAAAMVVAATVIATVAWRPMAAAGWGVIVENEHAAGIGHANPAINAVAEAHEALNGALWHDGNIREALTVACRRVADAQRAANDRGVGAAMLSRLVETRDDVCVDVDAGALSHFGAHDSVAGLENAMLAEAGRR